MAARLKWFVPHLETSFVPQIYNSYTEYKDLIIYNLSSTAIQTDFVH